MATENLRLTMELSVPPAALYKAWLNAREHAAFTGSDATVEPRVGGRHTAHDGYIHGFTLALSPGKRIVQSWRTTEFPVESPDSLLEVQIAKAGKGSRLTLVHKDIPEGQGEKYREGWEQFYFVPMRTYFERKVGGTKKPAAKTRTGAKAKAKTKKRT